jgi:hypothetical protein
MGVALQPISLRVFFGRLERLIDFRLDGQFNPISFYSLKDTLYLFSSS